MAFDVKLSGSGSKLEETEGCIQCILCFVEPDAVDAVTSGVLVADHVLQKLAIQSNLEIRSSDQFVVIILIVTIQDHESIAG